MASVLLQPQWGLAWPFSGVLCLPKRVLAMGELTPIITPWHTVSLTLPGKPSWNTSAMQMRGPESGLRGDLLRTPAGGGGGSHPGLCGLRRMLSHTYYQVSLTWAAQWGKAPAGLHGLEPQPSLASRHMSL